MDLISLLKLVVSRLENLKIPYLLTGGLAVSFWGLPRTTHDIDIVIEAKKEENQSLSLEKGRGRTWLKKKKKN